MKKILFLILTAAIACGQVNVQKSSGVDSTGVLNKGFVVGNGNSITTSGTGTIVATGGTATTMPWTGLTAIPSPTVSLTGDATGTITLLGTVATSSLTLANVTTGATTGAVTRTLIITFDNKGRILTVTTQPLTSHEAQTISTTGTLTITPTSVMDTQNVTLSGSAGVRPIVLNTAGAAAGMRCDLIFSLPATAGLAVTVYNDSTGGTVLQTFTTTGTPFITAARLSLEFTGSAWQPIFFQGPIP